MKGAPLIVSPHLDDAILSCGQYMADRLGTTVVTVFSGMPDDTNQLTSYDKTCGFENAKDAITTRQEEDKNACSVLMAEQMLLGFVDGQYNQDRDAQDIAQRLRLVIKREKPEYILFPLGVEHPDHRLVSEIVLGLDLGFTRYAYEELPGRVLFPESVSMRLERLGNKVEFENIPEGDLAKKMDAVWCYRSQLGVLDRRCLFVPERFWKVV